MFVFYCSSLREGGPSRSFICLLGPGGREKDQQRLEGKQRKGRSGWEREEQHGPGLPAPHPCSPCPGNRASAPSRAPASALKAGHPSGAVGSTCPRLSKVAERLRGTNETPGLKTTKTRFLPSAGSPCSQGVETGGTAQTQMGSVTGHRGLDGPRGSGRGHSTGEPSVGG